MCTGVGESKRNSTMAQLVGKWISLGHNPAEVAALAHGVNAQNRPPMEADEVDSVVRSVHETHRKNQENSQNPEIRAALAVLREQGVEPPAALLSRIEKVETEQVQAKIDESLIGNIQGMSVEQAIDYVGHELSNLPERLIRIEQSVKVAGLEIFTVVLESGRRVTIGGIDVLLSAARFNSICAVEFRVQIPPALRKKGAWHPVADAMLRAAVLVDDTFDPVVEAQEWLRDYCSGVRAECEWERLHKAGKPYLRDGFLHVAAGKFASWVRVSRDVKLTSAAVCDLLRSLGMERVNLPAPDPDKPGVRVCRSYCRGVATWILGGS